MSNLFHAQKEIPNRARPPSGQCPKKEFLHDGWFKNPNMSSQIQDNDGWLKFIRWIQHDLRFFSLKGPILVDEALGSGFVDSGPRRWLSPPALAICSQAVIYGRRIISLDNRSHYHLGLESLSSARFLFLSSSRVLLSCGPSVVVGQVTALSHRLHIDCINLTSSSDWYLGVKVRAVHSVEIMVVSRSRVTAVLPPLIRLNWRWKVKNKQMVEGLLLDGRLVQVLVQVVLVAGTTWY